VPFAPGGNTDIIARVFAPKMGEILGQQIVIDNRGGAGSTIGTEVVARAAPDGYVLLMVSAAHTINPAMIRKLNYDSVKDFAPLGIVADVPTALVVHPSLPVKNVKELVALARSQPGALTYGSAGQGSSTHLAFALFTTLARIDITHVPYKGTGPALVDTLSGQVQMLMGNVLSSLQHAKTGKLRVLGVSTAKRSAALPAIPTIAEAGVAGYETSTWHGWFAPAGTPPAIIDRLSAELAKSAKAIEVLSRLQPDGAEPVGSSPEQLRQFVVNDIARWRKVVRDAGIRLE